MSFVNRIAPLSHSTLRSTIALTNSVFPEAAEKGWPEIAYKASLGYKKELSIIQEDGTSFCRYWTIQDRSKTFGTIGLYQEKEDPPEKAWLGWFCVANPSRGKGIGRYLLEFATEEAKRMGCKELWLYTSRDPDEAVAQVLYEKMGFEFMEEFEEDPYPIFYRRKVIA